MPGRAGTAKAAARRPRGGAGLRLKPEERERQIIEEATRYFAAHGFESSTVELARRLGITQPLLFRYFPTKEAMIDRIYEEILPQVWDPGWGALISDETVPLRDRLIDFYTRYTHAMLSNENTRLFLFAGLARFKHGARYYEMLRADIFPRIARAIRSEFAPEVAAGTPLSEDEIEAAQTLHGAVYHMAVRRWVHRPPLRRPVEVLIPLKVDIFLAGVGPVIRTLRR